LDGPGRKFGWFIEPIYSYSLSQRPRTIIGDRAPPCGGSRSPPSLSVARGSHGRHWSYAMLARDRRRYPRPPAPRKDPCRTRRGGARMPPPPTQRVRWGTQLPAQLGQPIGANVALDQPPADALFKFCELWRLDRESGRRGGLCQALRWRAVAEGQLAVILKTSRRPEPAVQDMALAIQKFLDGRCHRSRC
jgi:hypothetical protein